MERTTGRDDDDGLPRDWKMLVLGKVAGDLLEGDASAANADIPSTSARSSACGGVAAAYHEEQHSRPRNKERLNLGSNLPYEILDHHSWGRRLNTLAGEGTSTDTTLQCRNFFNGEGTSSSAVANIGVAVAANQERWRNAHHEIMAADEEGWRNVHRELGGGELVAIGEKTVTKSDRDKHQSRLLLTNDLRGKVNNQVSNNINTEIEKINSDGGLEVKVIDPVGREYNMKCRYRECQKGMVINGGWNTFLENHDGLEGVATLSISAFRSRQKKLCFVIFPRRGPDQHQ